MYGHSSICPFVHINIDYTLTGFLIRKHFHFLIGIPVIYFEHCCVSSGERYEEGY